MAGLLRPDEPEAEVIDPSNIGALRVRNSEGVEGVLQTVNGRQVFTPLPAPEGASGPLDAMMLEAGRAATTLGTRIDAALGDERARYDVRQQDAQAAPIRDEYPIASAIGASLPGMAIPGGILAQTAVGAAEGALDTPETPVSGALMGGTFGFAGSKFGDAIADSIRGLSRRLSTSSATRARQAARDMAAEAGIPLTVAERTDSAVAEFFDRQASTVLGNPVKGPSKQRALNKAFSRALGVEGADSLDGAVLNQAAQQYGEVFERAANEVDAIPLTDTFASNLEALEQTARDVVPNSRAMRQLERVQSMALLEQIDGKQYNRLRSELGKLSRAEWSSGGDSVSAEFIDDIIGTLDSALQEVAPPDMVFDLSDARAGWKLLAAARTGAAISPDGNVNPVSMARALERSYQGLDLNRFAPGAIGRAQRANLAATAFPPYKSSGTAERSIFSNLGGMGAGLAELGLGGGAASQIGGGLARGQLPNVNAAIEATANGLMQFIGAPDDGSDEE